jgi:hypothetical protein
MSALDVSLNVGRSTYLEYALRIIEGRTISQQEAMRQASLMLGTLQAPMAPIVLPDDAKALNVEEHRRRDGVALAIKACMRNRHPRRRRAVLPTIEWSHAPPSFADH